METRAHSRSLTSRTKALVALGLLTSAVSCAGPFKVKMPGGGNEAEKRLRIDAIRRAEVWRPTRVSSLDLEKGPEVSRGFAPNATVQCDYVDEKLSGRSPKFSCALGRGDKVKVKYGKTNGEVYAEVAATRLFWALGFGADHMYPVRVICRGCPADLEGAPTANRRRTRFDPAAIERKMKGTELDWNDTEGWSWSELDLVSDAKASKQHAQRDALKLLAAMLQHTDSKSQQQRLLCLDEPSKKNPTTCERPFMMINDLGLTFGHSNLLNRNSQGSANFEKWVGGAGLAKGRGVRGQPGRRAHQHVEESCHQRGGTPVSRRPAGAAHRSAADGPLQGSAHAGARAGRRPAGGRLCPRVGGRVQGQAR